jgi:hypothetical protein
MTSLVIFVLIILALGVLGGLADRLGVDSRDDIGDTHAPRVL